WQVAGHGLRQTGSGGLRLASSAGKHGLAPSASRQLKSLALELQQRTGGCMVPVVGAAECRQLRSLTVSEAPGWLRLFQPASAAVTASSVCATSSAGSSTGAGIRLKLSRFIAKMLGSLIFNTRSVITSRPYSTLGTVITPVATSNSAR